MYTVEVETLDVAPSITYPLTEVAEPGWTALATVPRCETEQEELAEARALALMARRFYVNVRITKAEKVVK